jgi:hypothetical protein
MVNLCVKCFWQAAPVGGPRGLLHLSISRALKMLPTTSRIKHSQKVMGGLPINFIGLNPNRHGEFDNKIRPVFISSRSIKGDILCRLDIQPASFENLHQTTRAFPVISPKYTLISVGASWTTQAETFVLGRVRSETLGFPRRCKSVALDFRNLT